MRRKKPSAIPLRELFGKRRLVNTRRALGKNESGVVMDLKTKDFDRNFNILRRSEIPGDQLIVESITVEYRKSAALGTKIKNGVAPRQLSEQSEAFLTNPKLKLTDALVTELGDAVERGVPFQRGRLKGAAAKVTQYIHELAKGYSTYSAAWLFKKADKKILGKMALGTFQNHVSAARRK